MHQSTRTPAASPSPRKTSSPLVLLAGAVAVTIAATSATNALIAALTPRLGPRLNGYFGRYPARYGDLAYIVAGTGTPIVLLHGLDAGRSMAEWRAVFDALAQNHTVYAFDWQGFGMSDANLEGYRAREFADQLSGFLRDLLGADANATVVAAGQSAVFALMAANEGAPIGKLVLVNPQAPAPDEPSRHARAEALALSEAQKRLLNAPVLGAAFINWLLRGSNLVRVANASLWNKARAATEARLWHQTAHQNGAERAQRAFWQGEFRCDWRSAWRENNTPTLLLWGRHAREFEAASEWLALRPDARLEVIEHALEFPHLDEPEDFVIRLKTWLDEASA